MAGCVTRTDHRQLDRREQLSIIHLVGKRRPTRRHDKTTPPAAPLTVSATSGHSPGATGPARCRNTAAGLATSRGIPACAGNSGEQRYPVVRARGTCGSSLRVRGTGSRSPRHEVDRRVIPACAGNSAARSTLATTRTGHPCVCREQTKERHVLSPGFGSSLRVRGTAQHPSNRQADLRVIPACAGNRRYMTIATARQTGGDLHRCGFPGRRFGGSIIMGLRMAA